MQPYFVVAGSGICEPIASMPGIFRWSIDLLVAEVGRALAHGLRHIILFGVLAKQEKDLTGKVAANVDSVVAQAVRALKMQFRDDITIATDICLCGYLEHGHCGILKGNRGGVDNDATWEPLAAMALAHAEAGADIVAPSDMMDGRVGYIRGALEKRGHTHTVIMSYSVKYASAYYGPFREAAASSPAQGDRRAYQMDMCNVREAIREVLLDLDEGADMVMVKPALPYLDVIAAVRAQVLVPVVCYSVGGEYAMIKAGASLGYIDEAALVFENFSAMSRAGAQLIISYHASMALEQGWWMPCRMR
jgi:porphobilinogen synthase